MNRSKQYLQKYINDFSFGELSEGYLAKLASGPAGSKAAAEGLRAVPVPFKSDELKSGLSTLSLAKNMALVLGVDPEFRYAEAYKKYIASAWGEKFAEGLLRTASELAANGEFLEACCYFRACMELDPQSREATYGYALACKALYEESHDEEFTGRFKAESIEYLEKTAEAHPDFAGSYYHLGYAYANMGLYVKAKAAWEKFAELDSESETAEEVKARLRQIEDPAEIELGYTAILAGRAAEGVPVLEAYTEGEYARWWPLYYYLGIGYESLGMAEEAKEAFLKVLSLNASHIETMRELSDVCEALGEHESAEKYRKKADLLEN